MEGKRYIHQAPEVKKFNDELLKGIWYLHKMYLSLESVFSSNPG